MRLGIALEGGGARCAAQAGVLLALKEMGIRPALFAGCGAGALIAALGACDMLRETDLRKFGMAVRKNATLRNAALGKRLCGQFGDLPLRDARPLAMPAIDMETGAVQVFASMLPVRPDPRPWSRQARISSAVRCVMAAPGVLPPIAWRGHNLCGGGQLRGTLPSLLRAMGAEHVLCVRVLDAGCARHEAHPAAQAVCAHAMAAAPPPGGDIVVNVSGYAPGKGVLDKATLLPLLAAGKAAAVKALPAIEAVTGGRGGKIVMFPGGTL